MNRHMLAMVACAWVLWVQTRTSGPDQPVKDAWDIVDTFETQEDCHRARVAIRPPTATEGKVPAFRTRYVCFPDTLDPKATP